MTQPEPSNGRTQPPAAPPPRKKSRWQRVLRVLVILYGASTVLLCAWMYWLGDREWLATLVLFGPRWLCGVPLPLLVVAAAVWYRRLLWILAPTAYVLFFPFMGFEAHWPAAVSAPVAFRVLTCNVDQNTFDPAALVELIDARQPDVVALQEVKDATRFIWPDDWHVLQRDEFILASRWPIAMDRSVRKALDLKQVAAIFYRVELPDREVRIVNLHLRSPRVGIEAVLEGDGVKGAPQLGAILEARSIESQDVSNWIGDLEGPVIVVGDFNMPSESTVFRRDWTWMPDAFGQTGWGFGYTKISGTGALAYGSRIDHVLYDAPWSCIRSWVGPSIGSDHSPLFAEFR